MSIPNINLRVFRRDSSDMTLIYNSLELPETLKQNPKIMINNKEIIYFIADEKVKDSSRGDIFVLIPYYENDLNESDEYLASIYFDNFKYLIEIKPKGMLPNLKDDIKKISQVMGYDDKIKRWVKLPLEKTNESYHLNTHDKINNDILINILEELKKINIKIK